MSFEKGRNKTGGIKKGQKQPKTLVKIALAEKIAELDGKLYDVAEELLQDPKQKGFMAKELLKYRLPQKREIQGNITGELQIKFVNIKENGTDTTNKLSNDGSEPDSAATTDTEKVS